MLSSGSLDTLLSQQLYTESLSMGTTDIQMESHINDQLSSVLRRWTQLLVWLYKDQLTYSQEPQKLLETTSLMEALILDCMAATSPKCPRLLKV